MRKGIILRTSLMTVLSLSLLGLSQEPHAVPAYDASAALSGNRTIESGLTGTGPFDHHEASGILWDITEDEGQYHYNYTLFGFSFDGGSAINHLTLDISDLCSATAGCLLNVRLNGQPIGSFLQFSALIDGISGGPSGVTCLSRERTAAAPTPASAIMASRPFKTLLCGRTHKHRQSLNPPLCYACHWAKRPCRVAHPYRRSYVNAVGGPIQTK
jgi:hypothetical protein